MRNAMIGAVAALAVLAGCGETAPDMANVQVPGPDPVQNQIETMPEGQRNAVFIRAIRDAGQECQNVERSERAGEHQGFPVWNAHCAGGGTWTIVVMNDGNAAVLNAAEARLATLNEVATQNAQDQ